MPLSEEEKLERRRKRSREYQRNRSKEDKHNDYLKFVKTHPDYHKKQRKEYYEKNKAELKIKMRATHFRLKYGITIEEYEKIAEEQNNKCAICGKEETHIHKGKLCLLSIDHNHDTGEIRGLLCNACNQAIGYFREDINIIDKAIEYIKKHNCI